MNQTDRSSTQIPSRIGLGYGCVIFCFDCDFDVSARFQRDFVSIVVLHGIFDANLLVKVLSIFELSQIC